MRNLKPTLIAVASALALSAGAAMAQEVPSFEELDRDGDGYISRTEAMAVPCLAENLDAITTQSDQGLNREEYGEAVERFC
jgi:hypothetical protein